MSLLVEVVDVSKTFALHRHKTLKEIAVLKARRRQRDDLLAALDSVSLTVHEGDAVALIGLNGSGKSTLLKLISGVMRPDRGQVRTRGRTAGLIEVGAGLHPDLTGRENIFLNGAILGMTEREITRKFDAIVDFSDIEKFLQTEVKYYSSGMFLRLAFSVAVHTEPDLFLVDEILSVGDEPFQQKCLSRIQLLREEGRTLVVVSHDMRTLEKVCDRGVLLQEGRLAVDGALADAVTAMRAD